MIIQKDRLFGNASDLLLDAQIRSYRQIKSHDLTDQGFLN